MSEDDSALVRFAQNVRADWLAKHPDGEPEPTTCNSCGQPATHVCRPVLNDGLPAPWQWGVCPGHYWLTVIAGWKPTPLSDGPKGQDETADDATRSEGMTTESTAPPQALVDEARKALCPRSADYCGRCKRAHAALDRLADALSQSNARLEEGAEALGAVLPYAEHDVAHILRFNRSEVKAVVQAIVRRAAEVHAKLKGGK